MRVGVVGVAVLGSLSRMVLTGSMLHYVHRDCGHNATLNPVRFVVTHSNIK